MVKPTKELRLSNSDYIFSLAPLESSTGLVASVSTNSLHLIASDLSRSLHEIKNAHSGTITGLKPFTQHTVVSSGAKEGIRIWDFRESNVNKPVLEFTYKSEVPILSIDTKSNFVAAGTELVGVDAGVHIWDIRNLSKTFVSYIDSHNDDVTDVKFHPTDNNALLSGSTDGLVNVYNCSIQDEDDAVYQTINHGASIHSMGFLSEKRIFALSHMETFSIYQVADPDENVPEPKPIEFGDVREAWGCEYVIDMFPSYIGAGNYEKQNFKLIPFANEQPDISNVIEFEGGHGEEVVRSLFIDDARNKVYSAGEDGVVRLWSVDGLDCSASYFKSKPWVEEPTDVDMKEVSTKRSHEKKDKKHKKDKKDKKHSKEKKRYNPY